MAYELCDSLFSYHWYPYSRASGFQAFGFLITLTLSSYHLDSESATFPAEMLLQMLCFVPWLCIFCYALRISRQLPDYRRCSDYCAGASFFLNNL